LFELCSLPALLDTRLLQSLKTEQLPLVFCALYDMSLAIINIFCPI